MGECLASRHLSHRAILCHRFTLCHRFPAGQAKKNCCVFAAKEHCCVLTPEFMCATVKIKMQIKMPLKRSTA
jgi:hypothetical protein